MTLPMEIKKCKRTGFFPAFLAGGITAAAFPIVNTAARPEMFVGQPLPAIDILLNANGQMMTTLNLCLAVIGACILYHTEFADRAMQKMASLPLHTGRIFWNKCVLLVLALLGTLLIEAAALLFCAWNWFPPQEHLLTQTLKAAEYAFALMLPSCVVLMLISSQCRNMWITLGTGVICIFTVSVLPTDSRVLSFFPFSLPFQTLAGAQDSTWIFVTLAGCAAELFLAAAVSAVILKVRREYA